MKIKIKFFTSLTFSCLFAVTCVAQIPTDGLIRFYPFSGNADDLSASHQNGTVIGAELTYDRFGNPSSAYLFKASETDFVAIPYDGLNLPAYTYSAWASLNTLPQDGKRYWVMCAGASPAGDQSMNYNNYYTLGGNGWAAHSYGTGSSVVSHIYDQSTAVLNNWYHIVVTREEGWTKLYVNGVLKSSTDAGTGNFPYYATNNPKARIGARFDSSLPFDGSIDDVRIYNRALTPEEVTSLYFAESLCVDRIAVTDTLIINVNLSSVNPIVAEHTIKIYPNPANDYIVVDFGADYTDLDGYTLKITNAPGATVYTGNVTQQTTSINLSTWTGKGTYFVHLIDDQENTIDIRKIILQ